MAQFEPAYQRTAKHEGGYQKNPNDPGNYNSLGQLVGTNWGIAAFRYEDWISYPPGEVEMRQMPKSVAKQIYRRFFWDKIQGDRINNQAVAEIFYDGVVNHGRGVCLMQAVLGVKQDNRFGPKTLAALNASDPQKVYVEYREVRRQYYHCLVQNDNKLKVFLNGWLKRISKFQDYSPAAIAAGGSFLGIAILGGILWKMKRA